ncbi:MAG: transposase [Candidatus Omnitrophica bacterium]|nr:transposase [Candidatus Omnitrophota bacterium]
MPREPRIYIENVLYLVTAKGDENRNLFSDSQDFNAYLQSLSEYKKEFGFKLFAFALLPKSLCLLVELKNNVTISNIMHNLNSRYTKTYNGRYGKKGHLFQSRFKSVLIEKDDYLLRISRYVHILPKDSGITDDPAEYLYSSFSSYFSDGVRSAFGCEMPDMHDEIKEILSRFTQMETDTNRRKAYEGYVRSADDKEAELVRKLLHRKGFVGSKDFSEKIRSGIKHHIIEEEESRIVRKTRPGFVLAGGLVILFLGTVAYNFYKNQSTLQESLNVTTSGFETAREDLASRVFSLQNEITGFEERENYGLGGLAWELQLMPVQHKETGMPFKDRLHFKNGKVISSVLMERGFSPFDYTISKETHGKMIWKTVQTNSEGLTVRWYGTITGDTMRGVLSESPACRQAGRADCENRDFSFVSLGRVKNQGMVQNAIQ